MDFSKDLCDHDGESWTDQETFFLLEALEIYGENWNEISEHVGTKSKAQCILHFIRLPMESSLLENIEIPQAMISNDHRDDNNGLPATSSNGDPSSGIYLAFITWFIVHILLLLIRFFLHFLKK